MLIITYTLVHRWICYANDNCHKKQDTFKFRTPNKDACPFETAEKQTHQLFF